MKLSDADFNRTTMLLIAAAHVIQKNIPGAILTILLAINIELAKINRRAEKEI